MFVELPVAEADPRRSYERVRAASERHKASGQPLASSTLVALTELAPPSLHVGLARTAVREAAVQRHDHQRPRSAGAPVLVRRADDRHRPDRPARRDHAVGIAVVSYAGRMTFGLIADRGSVPDLDVLRDGIATSLFELATLLPRPRQAGAHRRRSATRSEWEETMSTRGRSRA